MHLNRIMGKVCPKIADYPIFRQLVSLNERRKNDPGWVILKRSKYPLVTAYRRYFQSEIRELKVS